MNRSHDGVTFSKRAGLNNKKAEKIEKDEGLLEEKKEEEKDIEKEAIVVEAREPSRTLEPPDEKKGVLKNPKSVKISQPSSRGDDKGTKEGGSAPGKKETLQKVVTTRTGEKSTYETKTVLK